MDLDEQILPNVSDAQLGIHSPENEEQDTSNCLIKHEMKDKEISSDVSENEMNQMEELEIKADDVSLDACPERSDANPNKSGASSVKKPMENVSGTQKSNRAHSSKGRPNEARIPEGKSRVVKQLDIQSSTLRQHEKIPRSQSNFTVPQPFALATDRRASLGGGQVKTLGKNQVTREDEKRNTNGDKGEDMNHNDVVRIEETKGQLRASTNTFNFNSDARAQRRKEFNSKLEERLTAKEAAKSQAQDKTKEVIEEEIKKFRKGLTFKATPMPSFYQDSTPPKLEIKKIPPTRARSPKLGRKNNGTSASYKLKEGAVGSHEEDQNMKENNGEVKVGIKIGKPRYLSKKVPGPRSNQVANKISENEHPGSEGDNGYEKCDVGMTTEVQSNTSGVVIVV